MAAGIRITASLDDERLQKGLQRLIALGAKGSPQGVSALRQIGSYLVASVINRFETESGPGGVPWKRSRRAEREKGQTLTDTGRLRSSITYNLTPDGLEVGTNVVYAAIHQFGGRTPPRKIVPKRKKALYFPGAAHPVKSVNHPGSDIPARPFLGLDDRDRVAISRIIVRMLERAAS